MREIKFRAWDVDNKTWINLWILRFTKDGEVMAVEELSGDGDSDIFAPGQIVLCQFTGLKDKNGKEIYEGDILYNEEWKTKTEVKFKEGAFNPLVEIESDETTWSLPDEFEVIGNIYENPELLRKVR